MKNEDIKKIKKWLPRGYGKVVQEKTGFSLAFIYQVVSGSTENDEVYNALLEVALENKKKIEERTKLISTL